MAESFNSPEREITPEPVAMSRRKWLKTAGITTAVAGAAGAGGVWWYVNRGTDEEILQAGQVGQQPGEFYPARRSDNFTSVDRPITSEAEAARYCNFYEFTSTKRVWAHVEPFEPLPWTIEVTGRVAQPRTFDMDSLLRTFTLEERVYRHRCVEAWAMVVPWVGFPLRELIRRVEPLSSARYVRFTSFNRPDQASHQQNQALPWPYTEGLSLDEANNELAFIATGMYGHPLLKQHGAPVRLVVPWKYGFKSIKSITRIEFTGEQPTTFWNSLQPREYDFWANVDPNVPHPRWSQRTERMLGTGERFDTRVYNGYGEWVADLYER